MWKDGKTTRQVLEKLIRSHLIRCHGIISKDYPEIATMDPVSAADHLIHLRRAGKVEIKLYSESPHNIGCSIIEKVKD